MRFARGVLVGVGGGGSALALGLAVALGACGLDRPGGSSPIDASIDAGSDTGADAGSDVALDDVVVPEAGLDAGDASDGGSDANPCGDNYRCGATGCATFNDCSACDAGRFACVGTASCVADCTTCGGYTVTCCNSNGSPNGVCQADTTATACTGSLKHCACNGGLSECLGANQICDNNDCLSCGESASDGGACKDGGNCSGAPLACR